MSDTQDQQAQSSAPPPGPGKRRRSRLWRITKWTLLILLILIVLLVGLVAWVAGTDTGTEFAWHQARRFMPASVHIDSLKGRLIGPLHIRGVDYNTDTKKVHVGAIDFDMNFSAIWHRTVHIKHLDVDNVDYQVIRQPTKQPPKQKKPFSLPQQVKLPLKVIVDRVTVSHVTAITSPKAKPIKVDRVKLADARLDKKQWHIKSLTGHGPKFNFAAFAAVTPGGGYNTHLHAKADVKLPNYAPVAATADIKGPLDDLHIAAKVDAPYNLTLTGQVRDALSHVKIDATIQAKELATHKIAKKLPEYAPLTASANIKGSPDDLHLTAHADAPYNVAVTARVSGASSDRKIDARIQAKGVKTRKIKKSLPPIAADADIKAKGTLKNLALKLSANIDSADYGKANLNGELHYTPKAINIEKLTIGVPATDGQLTTQGEVALGGDKNMDLTVDWSKLAWPLSNEAKYTSDHGQLRLSGTLKDYELKTDLVWKLVGQTQGKLTARGSGSLQAFDLKSLDISGAPGHITGRATARWKPKLDVTAHLQGSHIDPGAVVANMAGDFNLRTDITAQKVGHVIHAHVKQLSAHGSLQHHPLDLKAQLNYLGKRVDVDKLHLVYGATTADVKGDFGWTPDAKLDVQWAIHSKDLSKLTGKLAGSLNTEGRVTGRFKTPNVRATLKARGLEAFGNKVAGADLDARVDWSGNTQSRVALTANGVDAADQKIRKVALDLDGTPAAHKLTLSLDSAMAKANLALNGSLNKKTHQEQFTLEKLRAAYRKLPPWSLASPASGRVSAKAQSIDDACLTSGKSRVCLTGGHDAKGSKAQIKLSDFNYDYAKSFFPKGLNARGSVSGQVNAMVPKGGSPDIDVDLHTTAGKVTMANPQGKAVEVLDMQPGRIQAKMADNGLNARIDLPLAGGDGVRASARVASGSGSLFQHALNGKLYLGLASLDFITKLSPQVAAFDGKLTGDMVLAGTPAKPEVTGRVALNATRLELVTPGLKLSDVSLVAKGRGETIGISAKAKSGGGTLDADGEVSLAGSGPSVNLTITGDKFEMVNIPDVTAYVSPDLKVAAKSSEVDVSGKVTIPEASIAPKNLPKSGATTNSSDLTIVSTKRSTTQKAQQAVHADVTVILGKKVHIKAFGLKSDLGGELRVVQQPGNEATGSGAIELIHGSYKAYGQNLDIQRGKILFAGGPVSQPGLDIKAARYPREDITVGVHVSGSLKKPKLQLFSHPAMSQNEQLSWLLLGRPLESDNSGQSSLITRAALALGSSRANGVLNGLGEKLGLQVGVGAGLGTHAGEDTNETALTVGKYLSPKLYVGYGLGLFDQLSTVIMRYTLSSHWTLQTETSSKGTGGDVIWRYAR